MVSKHDLISDYLFEINGYYDNELYVKLDSFYNYINKRTVKAKKIIDLTVRYVNEIPEVDKMAENTVYISKKYNTASHLCLCGCKNEVATPLIDEELNGTGWIITEEKNNPFKITFAPSILNTHCPNKCHYVIQYSKGFVF